MKRHRLTEIDGLRGIAAIVVMLFHYFFIQFPSFELGKPFHYGYMGVSLFFIISGYVIFMSIQGSMSVVDFIQRRMIRLYPTYWACLLLTILVMMGVGTHQEILSIDNILLNLTMFQRFIGGQDIDGAYWTLAVEWMFYLTVALLIYFGKVNKILEFFIGVIILVLIFRIIDHYFFPQLGYVEILLNQLRYFHLFLAGIAIFKIHNEGHLAKYHLVLVFCVIMNLSVRIRFSAITETIMVVSFLLVFLLLGTSKRGLLNILNHRILQFFGRISYPLYLLNENFGFSIMQKIEQHSTFSPTILIPFVCGVVILFATLVNKFLEKPMMKLLDSLVTAFARR